MRVYRPIPLILLLVFLVPLIGSSAAAEDDFPTVETRGYTLIEDEAVLSGNLETIIYDEEGDAEEVDVFFRYGEGYGGTVAEETSKQSMDEIGRFQDIINVEPDTIYTYVAVVQWNDNETTGDEKHFRSEDYSIEEYHLSFDTIPAEDVTHESAVLAAEVTELDAEEAEIFFRWRETEVENYTETGGEEITEEGVFRYSIEGLKPETVYEFKSVVEGVSDEEKTGSLLNFTTEREVPETTDPWPSDGSEGIEEYTDLRVTVSHPHDKHMNVSFYDASDDSLINTRENVVDEEVSVTWTNLEHDETYEWYVVLEDDSDSVVSNTWTFNTTPEEVDEDPQIDPQTIEEDEELLTPTFLAAVAGIVILMGVGGAVFYRFLKKGDQHKYGVKDYNYKSADEAAIESSSESSEETGRRKREG